MKTGKLEERVVILGNGVAGYSAAYNIKKYREETPVTMISHEPYPLYSACALADYLAGEIARENLFLANLSWYKGAGILTRFGEKVVKIDTPRKEVLLNNEVISYDKLILATGSRAFRAPIKGIEEEGVYVLKSVGDADNILKCQGNCAVVIGSGPVGIETTVALKKRGLEVYLIESLPRVLPRVFNKGPSIFIRKILEDHGIKVFCEELVTGIIHKGKRIEVITSTREIKCDLVIVAAGMLPNSDIAQEARIKLGELGGIRVNERMETNVEGVYACGDCVETWDVLTCKNSLSLLWPSARKQGRVAGLNSVGIEKRYIGSVNYVGVDVFGVQGASLGTVENNDFKSSAVEKKGKDFFRRFLIRDGTIHGIQVIGDMKGIGMVMNIVKKKCL